MTLTPEEELNNLRVLLSELYCLIQGVNNACGDDDSVAIQFLRPAHLSSRHRSSLSLPEFQQLRLDYLLFLSQSPDMPKILERKHGRFACQNRIHPLTSEWLRRVYDPSPESRLSFWAMSDITGHSPMGIIGVIEKSKEEIQKFEAELEKRRAEIAESERKRAILEAYSKEREEYLTRAKANQKE